MRRGLLATATLSVGALGVGLEVTFQRSERLMAWPVGLGSHYAFVVPLGVPLPAGIWFGQVR